VVHDLNKTVYGWLSKELICFLLCSFLKW